MLTLVNQVNRDGKVTKNMSDVMKVGSHATRNDTVTTESTKAWVLFNKQNPHAIMLQDTTLSLGESCIELDKGRTLIVGKTCISIADSQGDAVSFVSTQSSVIIERLTSGQYHVKTLAGQATIGPRPVASKTPTLSLNQYPAINANFSIDATGYTYAYPATGGLLVGTLSSFVPLAQKRQASVLYSYTAVGSNLDGYWGASTEVGYRWFTPSNISTTSVYIGYSGFESPSCFSNYLNFGGQWQRARWRIGATAGLNTSGCDAGFDYGALNISMPVAKLGGARNAYISLTPYLLWGDNVISPFDYGNGGSSVAPGARLALSTPISDRLSIDAYGGVDTIFGAMIGGRINIRFPLGGRIVSDPNISNKDVKAPATIPLSQSGTPGSYVVVYEGYKATFTSAGSLDGSVTKIPSQEMVTLIKEYMEGIEPLPESNRIANVAASNNALTASTAGILGVFYLDSASLPVSRTAQQPFDVTTVFPTAAYACTASQEAKNYAEQRLREDGESDSADLVAAADTIYLGKGDNVSQGFPVTTSPSRAFRMANGATCSTINSIINNYTTYDPPRNPLSTQVLK